MKYKLMEGAETRYYSSIDLLMMDLLTYYKGRCVSVYTLSGWYQPHVTNLRVSDGSCLDTYTLLPIDFDILEATAVHEFH